ncbi:MAG: AraC family transcriptional regulator, partial [Eubacteriales bacterium]|nr:AraC family transcriptional regulator [Eubacteriales bacterium]
MATRIRKERKGMVLQILPQDNDKHEINFPRYAIADLETNYTGPSPYHLDYCGYEPCYPGYEFGPYRRSSFLIHLVTRGSGTYQTEEKLYHVRGGQMFLIYPDTMTTYRADSTDPWSYYWIGFSGHQCEYILSRMGFSKKRHVLTVSNADDFARCIDRMLQAANNTFEMELRRTAELLQFFAGVISNNKEDSGTGTNPKAVYAEMALRYISSHYENKVRISEIASEVGLNRSYLTRCFQEVYHISPQEYLLRLRMQKAANLLACTDTPVGNVAKACGYNDPLVFHKIFKRRFGVGPPPSAQRYSRLLRTGCNPGQIHFFRDSFSDRA